MKEITYVFGALAEPDVEALMRIGTRQQLRVGDRLLTERTHPDAIYLVLDGRLSVAVKGRDSVIAYVGKGDILGEMSLLEFTTSISHRVRHHTSDSAAHPSRRARREPCCRSWFQPEVLPCPGNVALTSPPRGDVTRIIHAPSSFGVD